MTAKKVEYFMSLLLTRSLRRRHWIVLVTLFRASKKLVKKRSPEKKKSQTADETDH